MSSRSFRFLSILLVMGLLILPKSTFANPDPDMVYGMVFNDSDQDGLFDDGEVVIRDVVVTLQVDGEVSASTTTDTSGNYAFSGLAEGSYSVVETDPAGYVSTTLNVVDFIVDGMTDLEAINFGDVPVDALSEISGIVYDDKNRNRIQDLDDPMEPGLPNVTVLLKDAEGLLLDSKETNGEGFYSFDGLLAGTYSVREEDPSGYYSTTPHEVTVILLPGEIHDDVFFGDFEPKPGELGPIDPILSNFFDLPILDVLDLRAIQKMGYGNIAKVYFASKLSGEPVNAILELLETEGGWGNVWKTVVGFSGLKGHNLGMIVSGREAPTPVMQLLDGCPVVETSEQLQTLMASGINQGSLKRLCGMVMEVGGDYEALVEAVNMRVEKMKWKEIQEGIEDPGGESQEAPAEHGPPACKGKNKTDPGC
jgi:hypothetical protein